MNKIKSILIKVAASAVLAIAPLVALGGVSHADGTVTWDGQQGLSSVNAEGCNQEDTPNPGDILWIFTATGASSATITINGQTFDMSQQGNGNGSFHFVQTGFNGDFSSLSVSAHFVGDTNSGNPQLTISHGCPAEGGQGGGPTMDCDNDFDSSPASECATTTTTTTPGQGQVLGATTPGQGAAQVSVVPQGSVNGGGGAASSTVSKVSAIGLFGSLLSAGAGLALLNRRQS